MGKPDFLSLKHVVISESPDLLRYSAPDAVIVSPEDYIAGETHDMQKDSRLRVINLCNGYDYLSKGYYCSLMAEARGQRCVPPVDNIITMNWKRLSRNLVTELNALLAKSYKAPLETEIGKTYLFTFGRSEDPALEFLSRRIFDALRFPLLSVELKHSAGQWLIGDIKPVALKSVPQPKLKVFEQALAAYTGKAWETARKPAQEKYWLGILHDPKEVMPPSNKGALEMFLRVAKKNNVYAELITKDDLSSLLEYDALFIRETTAIDHHTYRFAYKAEVEGMPVIDDTASIVRCSNKVFLHELLTSRSVSVPKTRILDAKTAKAIEKDLVFPLILKVPDGSFSRGVVKAATLEDYRRAAQDLFKRSALLLMQEFLPSAYDWRIGVLGGEPLFACRYFMARGHWQIYKHGADGKTKSGAHETVAIDDVPKKVLEQAIKATKGIGKGLYGVDLKETENGVYVIEVNDNPNIDKGVEDTKEGEVLYQKVIAHFEKLVNA